MVPEDNDCYNSKVLSYLRKTINKQKILISLVPEKYGWKHVSSMLNWKTPEIVSKVIILRKPQYG